MKILASAPSNIALIKYMGKTEGNRPSNPSISYSLDQLRTTVEISNSDSDIDLWQAMESEYPLELSEKSKARYLNFFKFLKNEFAIKGNFLVRSKNNFPSDAGLASSASSFAALTLACWELAKELKTESELKELGYPVDDNKLLNKLSALSRQGSGSSCRSLFSPWSVWSLEYAEEIQLSSTHLHHIAIVVDEDKKLVSSSEAHKRIESSLLNEGREARANMRMSQLLEALNSNHWQKAYEICWAEFWDMHALFESSEPNFGYMKPGSLEVLNEIRNYWSQNNDGPIVTMDAGPNIHLLFRNEQRDLYNEFLNKFSNKFKVWGSPCE